LSGLTQDQAHFHNDFAARAIYQNLNDSLYLFDIDTEKRMQESIVSLALIYKTTNFSLSKVSKKTRDYTLEQYKEMVTKYQAMSFMKLNSSEEKRLGNYDARMAEMERISKYQAQYSHTVFIYDKVLCKMVMYTSNNNSGAFVANNDAQPSSATSAMSQPKPNSTSTTSTFTQPRNVTYGRIVSSNIHKTMVKPPLPASKFSYTPASSVALVLSTPPNSTIKTSSVNPPFLALFALMVTTDTTPLSSGPSYGKTFSASPSASSLFSSKFHASTTTTTTTSTLFSAGTSVPHTHHTVTAKGDVAKPFMDSLMILGDNENDDEDQGDDEVEEGDDAPEEMYESKDEVVAAPHKDKAKYIPAATEHRDDGHSEIKKLEVTNKSE
jgi:hypothetical protein